MISFHFFLERAERQNKSRSTICVYLTPHSLPPRNVFAFFSTSLQRGERLVAIFFLFTIRLSRESAGSSNARESLKKRETLVKNRTWRIENASANDFCETAREFEEIFSIHKIYGESSIDLTSSRPHARLVIVFRPNKMEGETREEKNSRRLTGHYLDSPRKEDFIVEWKMHKTVLRWNIALGAKTNSSNHFEIIMKSDLLYFTFRDYICLHPPLNGLHPNNTQSEMKRRERDEGK